MESKNKKLKNYVIIKIFDFNKICNLKLHFHEIINIIKIVLLYI